MFEAPGALIGDCRANPQDWQDDKFVGKGGQHWLKTAFQTTGDVGPKPQCVAWVEHPLYFLHQRYHRGNVWHSLEDVTHAWETWALYDWGLDAQVLLLLLLPLAAAASVALDAAAVKASAACCYCRNAPPLLLLSWGLLLLAALKAPRLPGAPSLPLALVHAGGIST